MKYLAYALLVLVLAVAVALIAYPDPGHVVITYSGWTIESTVALLTVVLIATCVAFYILVRVWRIAWHLPRHLRRWRHNRHAARARTALTRGLIALAEGHWERAEHRLGHGAAEGDMPFLQHLAAARAAQSQGAAARRDRYLEQAVQALPRAELAVGILKAEMQLAHGELGEARATLARLEGMKPGHRRVLELTVRAHARLGDWARLLELLSEARKHKALTSAAADDLERRAHVALLSAARTAEPGAVEQAWRRVPRERNADEQIVLAYVTAARARGNEAAAEAVLYAALEQRWSSALAQLYGVVQGADAAAQLARAERWLKDHSEEASLRLTVGRLCMRSQLWGKARAHLEASLSLEPRAETYRELGALLERIKDPTAAMECYRQGLALLPVQAAPGVHGGTDADARPAALV